MHDWLLLLLILRREDGIPVPQPSASVEFVTILYCAAHLLARRRDNAARHAKHVINLSLSIIWLLFKVMRMNALFLNISRQAYCTVNQTS